NDPVAMSLDRVADRVDEAVKDGSRQKAALAVIDAMREIREETLGKAEEFAGRLSKANAAHDAPRADIESVLTELDAARAVSWQKQLDARFKLRESLTREEWQAVFGNGRR